MIAVLDRNGRVTAQPPQPAGHLVKARYLPLQAMVAGADEQGSSTTTSCAKPIRSTGCPSSSPTCLCRGPDRACDPPRPAGNPSHLRHDRPGPPLAFSRSVADCGLPACWQEPSPSGRRSVATSRRLACIRDCWRHGWRSALTSPLSAKGRKSRDGTRWGFPGSKPARW